jgi:DUF971 family protein
MSDIKRSAAPSASVPQPTNLTVRNKSRVLEVEFDDGAAFSLPFEYLRVYSPSAEVRGHYPGQETLQTGKRDVGIAALDPVGNYAVKPTFSDGHESGLYTWEYLYTLGKNQAAMWADYMNLLHAAGYPGDTGRDTLMVKASSGSACGHNH